MKKKVFLMAVVGAALTACSNHDFEVMTPSEQVQANYESAFKDVFGTPAANQDWGFGSRVLPSSFGSTRVARPENNMWKEWGYVIPSPITEDERKAVLEVFNQKGEESYTSLVDWSCYFVQQVYKGDATYTAEDKSTTYTGSNQMDWLCTVTDKKVTNFWPVTTETVAEYNDHVNNFNGSDGSMMLMDGTDSKKFGFKSSADGRSGDEAVFYNFRMEKIKGNYYVGFDFEANGLNKNQQVKRDYIYNDWIVKIVPGRGTTPSPEPKRYEARIICEDLSASTGTDFDFNDVVFDVLYVEGSNKTIVTIQAAGGTLPLYVNGQEVHQLFANANPDKKITTGTMINTNSSNGISGLAPVTMTIDHVVAPWDIEISVLKADNPVPLKAEVGTPAAKIAVDPSFVWCDEREDIQTKYPNFSNYVKNTNVDWY